MVKTFYAARVLGKLGESGYLLQKENCVVFVGTLEEATLYSSEVLLREALDRYDFGSNLSIIPIPVLALHKPDEKIEGRLFLRMCIDGQESELFAVTLSQERAEALAQANSAVSMLRRLYAMFKV